MAEFFKNLTKKVTEVASNVSTKAKDVYDVTLLKIDLRKKEADLDECFEKLGRTYYLNLKNNGNNEKVDALVEKAEKLSNEILELKNKIATLQNQKICVHCGSLIDKDVSYCGNCGQKVVANETAEDDSNEDTEPDYVIEILDD